jgi:hypothetical protein
MDLSVDDKSRKRRVYRDHCKMYLDVAVLEPTAFTVCKDVTTA